MWPLEDELEVRLMIDLIRHVTGQSAYWNRLQAGWLVSPASTACALHSSSARYSFTALRG